MQHPTKAKITAAAVSLLDDRDVNDLTVDEVLAVAGVTKGAMYHHFEDYAEVLESALIARYTVGVDWSIDMIASAFQANERNDEFLENLQRIIRLTHAPERGSIRLERVRTLALAEHHPRLREALSAEQQRLTDTITGLLAEARARGLVGADVDPHAGAVLIQAFTIGRVIDDLSERPVDPEAWYTMIQVAISRAFAV